MEGRRGKEWLPSPHQAALLLPEGCKSLLPTRGFQCKQASLFEDVNVLNVLRSKSSVLPLSSWVGEASCSTTSRVEETWLQKAGLNLPFFLFYRWAPSQHRALSSQGHAGKPGLCPESLLSQPPAKLKSSLSNFQRPTPLCSSSGQRTQGPAQAHTSAVSVSDPDDRPPPRATQRPTQTSLSSSQ